ncbi:hypothetical protein HanRHA438_Chr08g0372721 [Helianthus annuus]|uniref:Uncharacterized protein n=1 Tax=Helianthus annuus TaxID=4232 RepID=A0A9K3III2_HELAN|nr:hypothetical protein HanXRQr2_Chr08g0360731 [Helianthus annuus]KAJ0548941.1 hypothetical protein HanIR_Chr08g0389511 [Helianthus annuus]KAJ0555153.1 hypothetical protein HanHA89_Chr08g0316431 [Helianthus annuus]KAJ0723903.1 hypothetical protein HanOQP8_Chr08g0303851 [Helianthus annuus]KAJ0899799.1 hypothetical protein HanRHA438_Chr08g0372721 [Helianthus annuus]
MTTNLPTLTMSAVQLKTQIDKFYKGDFEAIPTIFESILKRK